MLKHIGYAAGVAVAFYVSGRLALLLAIPPGYSTPIFPASGVALVAVLLYGYRIWPGILVGHFLINIPTGYDPSSAWSVVRSLLLPLSIACGGALQATGSAALVRRAIGPTVLLQDEVEIAKFLGLGGPIGCLISATVGQVSLWAWGMVPPSDIGFSWVTWWVGDTIGVLVVSPLLLAWLSPPRERWRTRRAALTWSTAVALTLAVVLYLYISGREEQRIRTEFERTADMLGREFAGTVRRHLEAVSALQDLYASGAQVDRGGFAAFARPLRGRHPGVQALEWAPLVPRARRAGLEQQARRDGYPQFAIRDRDAQGELVAAADHPQFVPVLFVEPYEGNEAALGVDLGALPGRRDVLERARDSGSAAASGRLMLLQEQERQAGIVVAMPVYGGLPPPATTAGRRSALRGYVVGVYRVGDLVHVALLGSDTGHIDLAVTDDTAPRDEQMLYERRGGPAGLPWKRAVTLAVADHPWSIRFAPAADYAIVHRSWQPWTVLALGLLFASVLEMMVLLLTERAAAIQRVVDQRTGQLRDALKEKETLLREVHHRVKNNLQLISSLMNIQVRRLDPGEARGALKECQTQVQAIALVHEQLYQARDLSRVPFSQYVTSLASNAFQAAGVSYGAVRLDVDVAPVELGVDKAIPCGLVLNELITNALKHAFPDGRHGTVRVELARTGGRRVRLAVRDDGIGLPAGRDLPQSDTLGMQLIRTLAEQLAARLEVRREGVGTSFEIEFEA